MTVPLLAWWMNAVPLFLGAMPQFHDWRPALRPLNKVPLPHFQESNMKPVSTLLVISEFSSILLSHHVLWQTWPETQLHNYQCPLPDDPPSLHLCDADEGSYFNQLVIWSQSGKHTFMEVILYRTNMEIKDIICVYLEQWLINISHSWDISPLIGPYSMHDQNMMLKISAEVHWYCVQCNLTRQESRDLGLSEQFALEEIGDGINKVA